MRSMYFAIIICVLFSLDSHSNCHDLLRLEVQKRIDPINNFISSERKNKQKKIKSLGLYSSLNALKLSQFLNRESMESTVLFQELIIDSSTPYIYAKSLQSVHTSMKRPDTFFEWAQNLYNDVVVEVQLSGTPTQKLNFEQDRIISKDNLISVILNRLKKGGFSEKSEDILILDEAIDDYQFAEVLERNQLILDYYHQFNNHGDLIHIFHLDYLVYTLKENSFSPSLASELYQWFGRRKLGKDDSINLNLNLWQEFFDSNHNSFNSPESLNPILMKFFGIDPNETPSVAISKNFPY